MKMIKQIWASMNDWRRCNLFCTAKETLVLVQTTRQLSESELGKARDDYRAGLKQFVIIRNRPAKFRYSVTIEVDKDLLSSHASAAMSIGLQVANNLTARYRADMEQQPKPTENKNEYRNRTTAA